MEINMAQENLGSAFQLDRSNETEQNIRGARHPREGRVRKHVLKWQEIVNQWSKEKDLILKLVKLSLMGRSKQETHKLSLQSRALTDLFDQDLKAIETRLKELSVATGDSLSNISSTKHDMKRLAGVFHALKHDILAELARSYPITIV